MINIKRFPGLVLRYKAQCTTSTLFIAAALAFIYVVHHWRYVCTNGEIDREIDKLCYLYDMEEAVGNLCQSLCRNKFFNSISCISQHRNEIAFTAKWQENVIVVRSVTVDRKLIPNVDENEKKNNIAFLKKENIITEDGKKTYALNTLKTNKAFWEKKEKEVELEVRSLVRHTLNMSLTDDQLNSLRYLEIKNNFSELETGRKRKAEMKNVLELLRSQEYLLFRLFSDKGVFPRVLGTCGHFYAIEYLETPSFGTFFALDDEAEWSVRMKLAIAIMDFVEILETEFPDALYLCNIQMDHIGITKSGKIKFLHGNSVFSKYRLDKQLKNKGPCTQHKDCDFIDCRSLCNMTTAICDTGVANDNLQVICEKIFIGWIMSGKIIIPGLLMSENTPASLFTLLRLCAENRREPVSEDLRQRLYNILTEMHHILLQRLHSA